jgi:hypothetical protein
MPVEADSVWGAFTAASVAAIYVVHYHEECNHQGKENLICFLRRGKAQEIERQRCGVASGWAFCWSCAYRKLRPI